MTARESYTKADLSATPSRSGSLQFQPKSSLFMARSDISEDGDGFGNEKEDEENDNDAEVDESDAEGEVDAEGDMDSDGDEVGGWQLSCP